MSAPPSYDETAAYPPPADYIPKYPPPQNAPPQSEYTPQPPRPAPQPARQPRQQAANTVVVTRQVNFGMPSTSRTPVLWNCPFCETQQVTRVSYEYGGTFWVIFLIVFCLVGIFALFLLCFDEMKDVRHTCPNCNNVVGVHKAEC